MLDYYARVEEDRFVENTLLSFGEKSHPYTDVKMIAKTIARPERQRNLALSFTSTSPTGRSGPPNRPSSTNPSPRS